MRPNMDFNGNVGLQQGAALLPQLLPAQLDGSTDRGLVDVNGGGVLGHEVRKLLSNFLPICKLLLFPNRTGIPQLCPQDASNDCDDEGVTATVAQEPLRAFLGAI